MKIIKTKYLPNGTKAMNLFGVLFTGHNARLSDRDLNHESIHSAQIKEMWYIPFYLWYAVEWVVKLFPNKFDTHKTYRSVSFEREAFRNDNNIIYLESRKRFAWIKYIRK